MEQLSPNNLEAERLVLGSCLLDETSTTLDDVAELLNPIDFFSTSNQEVFSTLQELAQKGEDLDEINLMEALKARGTLDQVGGYEGISAIANEGSTRAKAVSKAAIVADKSRARKMIRTLRVGLEGISEGTEVDEVVAKVEYDINHLDESAHTAVDGLEESVDRVTDIIKQQLAGTYNPTTISTGIPSLDAVYQDGGLAVGTINIVAAPPSTGKSALALNMAMKAALKDNIPTLIFSFEMMEDQLVKRMASSMSRVSMDNVRKQKVSAEEQNKLFGQLERIKDSEIYTNHHVKDIDHLCAVARQSKRKHNIGLIVVDYLQLIKSRPNQGRTEAIEEITQALKRLSIELQAPVVLLAQFNRSGCLREDGPSIFDLKGGSSIEQDGDTILTMWVDGGDFEKAKFTDSAGKEFMLVNWKLAKNREGEAGVTGQFKFYGAFGSYKDVTDTNLVPPGTPVESNLIDIKRARVNSEYETQDIPF